MFLIQKAQTLKSRCWSGSVLSSDSGGDRSSALLSSHSCWQVSGFYAGVSHAFEPSLLSVFTQPTASCLQFQISLFFIRHQSLDRDPPPYCGLTLLWPYYLQMHFTNKVTSWGSRSQDFNTSFCGTHFTHYSGWEWSSISCHICKQLAILHAVVAQNWWESHLKHFGEYSVLSCLTAGSPDILCFPIHLSTFLDNSLKNVLWVVFPLFLLSWRWLQG